MAKPIITDSTNASPADARVRDKRIQSECKFIGSLADAILWLSTEETIRSLALQIQHWATSVSNDVKVADDLHCNHREVQH